MCYYIYLSTTDDRDLSAYKTPIIDFYRSIDKSNEKFFNFLNYPEKWIVGVERSCTCNFRHLHYSAVDAGLDFDAPKDWMEEDDESIEATKLFYDVITEILASGNQVDCVSVWISDTNDSVQSLNVDLSEVTRDAFRFFEGYHFIFGKTKAK